MTPEAWASARRRGETLGALMGDRAIGVLRVPASLPADEVEALRDGVAWATGVRPGVIRGTSAPVERQPDDPPLATRTINR